jgi:hypothetical protein
MIEKVTCVLLDLFSRLFGGQRPPGHPRDPYAYQPVPKKRGPQDRSAAVALAEPDDE